MPVAERRDHSDAKARSRVCMGSTKRNHWAFNWTRPPDIEFDHRSSQITVRLIGNDVVTTDAAKELARTLDREVESRKPDTLIFDFNDQMAISSSMVGLLLRYRRRGMDVHLLHPSEHVVEVLQRTKLRSFFQVHR